jgi:peptidyl-prolyl cis-trans isomerase B (cyclophilin B)
MIKISFTLILCASIAMVTAQERENKVKIKTKSKGIAEKQIFKITPKIRLTTDSGIIVIRLYDSTPLHRDNFIKLVQQHFYDSLMFHRVIKDFMIQGGDPDSKNAPPVIELGNGGPGYTIPAEFDTVLFHKKGVIAAAREGDAVNPSKASSGSQFYIVQGKKFTDAEMDAIEVKKGIKIPEAHRLVFRTIGGTPFLDMNYTVFGEVESGMEVVDNIASAARDANNRPYQDIRMKIEIIPEESKNVSKPKNKK